HCDIELDMANAAGACRGKAGERVLCKKATCTAMTEDGHRATRATHHGLLPLARQPAVVPEASCRLEQLQALCNPPLAVQQRVFECESDELSVDRKRFRGEHTHERAIACFIRGEDLARPVPERVAAMLVGATLADSCGNSQGRVIVFRDEFYAARISVF